MSLVLRDMTTPCGWTSLALRHHALRRRRGDFDESLRTGSSERPDEKLRHVVITFMTVIIGHVLITFMSLIIWVPVRSGQDQLRHVNCLASGAQGKALKEAKPKTAAGLQTRETEARGARSRGPGYESRDDGKKTLTELKKHLNELKII